MPCDGCRQACRLLLLSPFLVVLVTLALLSWGLPLAHALLGNRLVSERVVPTCIVHYTTMFSMHQAPIFILHNGGKMVVRDARSNIIHPSHHQQTSRAARLFEQRLEKQRQRQQAIDSLHKALQVRPLVDPHSMLSTTHNRMMPSSRCTTSGTPTTLPTARTPRHHPPCPHQ